MYSLRSVNKQFVKKELPVDDKEYQMLQTCIVNSNSMLPLCKYNQRILKVYKVRSEPIFEYRFQKESNILLFHGTSAEGAGGILRNGVNNSDFGKHGRAVYLTESPWSAGYWSYLKEKESSKQSQHIVIFEVMNTCKIEKKIVVPGHFRQRNEVLGFIQYNETNQVRVQNNNKGCYTKDGDGNLLKTVCPYGSVKLNYVTNSSLLVPRYIVVTGVEKKNTKELCINTCEVQDFFFYESKD